jgi:hypothetical protein
MNTYRKLIQPIAGLVLATALLLLIPLVAMQFTGEVDWSPSDFILAGSLLFGTGLTYIVVTRVLAPRLGDNIVYRVAVSFALFTGLFLIWSNLAVGIIGSENQAINLLYFGVIAVGIIGAFLVRFQPQGMAYVMFAMAFTQSAIAVFALFIGLAGLLESFVIEILGVNGFFVMLFAVAALLFRYAANEQDTPYQSGQIGTPGSGDKKSPEQ